LIALTLPWPPSINHYYGQRGSRKFIKKAGREFRARVADIVADNYCLKEDGRLALFIHVYAPDKRRRDIDNIVKATQDALQHAGCYEDDCQIDGLVVVRQAETRKGGEIRIVICQHRTISQCEPVGLRSLKTEADLML
jgi:crossover junction endodeoxyribonuclease RusA